MLPVGHMIFKLHFQLLVDSFDLNLTLLTCYSFSNFHGRIGLEKNPGDRSKS